MAPADHSAASSSGCKRGVPADELVQLAPDCAKRAKSKEETENAALKKENGEMKAALLEEKKNNGTLRGKLMQSESEKTQICEHFNETQTAMGKLLGEKEWMYKLLEYVMNEQKALNQYTESEWKKVQVAVQVLQGEKQALCGLIESQQALLLQNHQVHYNLGSQIHQLTQQLEARDQLLMVYRHLLIDDDDDDDEEAPAATPSETVDQVPNASPPSSSSASGC